MLTQHRAPYLPNGKAYELQTWYTGGGRRSASATGALPPRSKVKVARSRDQAEPSWPNAVPVSLAGSWGIPCLVTSGITSHMLDPIPLYSQHKS